MASRYKNKKETVENHRSIDIQNFKKWGYLELGKRIFSKSKWTRLGIFDCGELFFGVDEDNTVIVAIQPDENGKLRIDDNTIFTRIYLTTSKCNFGGKRYWFECGNCQGKVGKLFWYSELNFACRECLNLCYESQNKSGDRLVDKIFLADELKSKINNLRITHYKGKPTKKYSKLSQRLEPLNIYLESYLQNEILKYGS